MASSTVRMKNPKTDDVKVIPVELEKQFRERGWKQDTGSSSKSSSTSSSSK